MTIAFFVLLAIAMSPLILMWAISLCLTAKLSDKRIAGFSAGSGNACLSGVDRHERAGNSTSKIASREADGAATFRLKGPYVSHESGSEKLRYTCPCESTGSICQRPEKSMEAAINLARVENDKQAPVSSFLPS